jgi:phenylacetate-coenzyme A ligase PaaK-like adenylate-forming protein
VSSIEEYRAAFDERIFDVLRPAAHAVPALGARLAEAGLQPDDLVDVAALDRLAVQSKDDLIDLQAKDPPFGSSSRRARSTSRSPPSTTTGGPRRRWRRPGSAAATSSSTASATT